MVQSRTSRAIENPTKKTQTRAKKRSEETAGSTRTRKPLLSWEEPNKARLPWAKAGQHVCWREPSELKLTLMLTVGINSQTLDSSKIHIWLTQ